VLHLDDIQHADRYSLDLLQHILGDIKGYSSILFVGSFRNNELGGEHPGKSDVGNSLSLVLLNRHHITIGNAQVHGFTRKLETNGTLMTNIHLEGIKLQSLTALVSNSLRLVPRYCKDLSREVYRRTDGNP